MPTIRERNGKFQVIVRVKRNGVTVHTESKTFDTRALAEDWGKRLERRLKETGVEGRQVQRVTLEDYLDQYRQVRSEHKKMGRAILGDLDLLSRTLGAHRLSDLTPATWTKFARARRAEGAGPTTVLHNLAIARAALNAAKPMFGLQINGDSVGEAIAAMKLTGHVATSRKRDRRLQTDEEPRLLAEFRRVASHPSTIIDMESVVRVALALPRRCSELCSMRWEDYNGRTVVLHDTKNPRSPRTEKVPVPAAARKVIDALPRHDERILPYVSESVSAAFDRACDRLSIEDLRFHDLRHEGICRLFEAGLTIPEVSLISGHMSWSNLKRYTHLRPENVLEKLDARPQGIPQAGTEPTAA